MTMTPLDDSKARKAHNYRTHKDEIFFAASRCGRWTYRRLDEPRTPWVVTFVPTGQEQWGFPSLPKARRWTASEDVLTFLRRQAQDALNAAAAAERADAQQILATLDGLGKP